jgi:hypothetical protein
VYCLDCAKTGTRGAAAPDGDPEAVLRTLRELGEKGDAGARRLFFGILWDEGRSILCYRCKRGRPVRLTAEQVEALAHDAGARPAPSRTPTTAVGEKAALDLPAPRTDDRAAA